MGDIHRGLRGLGIGVRYLYRGMRGIISVSGGHYVSMGDIQRGLRGFGIGVRYLFRNTRGIISVRGGLYVSMSDIYRGLRDLVICWRNVFIEMLYIPGRMRGRGTAEVSKNLEN